MGEELTAKKPLGQTELIAIAMGGMIGGGIFSILGISVQIVDKWTPLAIFLGGVLAFFAAYSYSQLACYYRDEGATYSFFKRTFPQSRMAISAIGWLIVFGYISTLALYAFTFASYLSAYLGLSGEWQQQLVAILVIACFGLVNLASVNGMGKLEDILVYSKVLILLFVSLAFLFKTPSLSIKEMPALPLPFSGIFTCAAITFVAYEGFQLVIHAYEEVDNPLRNVPASIYRAIGATTFIYVLLSMATVFAVPSDVLIRDQEFALAAAAHKILGPSGYVLVIIGALLATSSAINGTIFGSSRLMAVIASDGVFPRLFAQRRNGHVPSFAIAAVCLLAVVLLLSGGLQLILEFGSMTFITVSFLMAYANFRIRHLTNSGLWMTLLAMIFLAGAGIQILVFEAKTDWQQLSHIFLLYLVLGILSAWYSRRLASYSE